MVKIIHWLNRYGQKLLVLLLVLWVLLFSILFIHLVYPKGEVTGKIIEKYGPSFFERNKDSGKVEIQLSDGTKELLVNNDNLLMKKDGKALVYQEDLTLETTYTFKTVGFSWPLLGLHPNILSYQKKPL